MIDQNKNDIHRLSTKHKPHVESITKFQPRLIDPSPVKIIDVGNLKVRIYRFTRTFYKNEKKHNIPFREVVYDAFDLGQKFDLNLILFEDSELFCKDIINQLKQDCAIFSSAIYFPTAEFLIDPTTCVDGICVYNQKEYGHSYHRYKFKHMKLAGYIGILSDK